jgi:hypothetical protein
VRLRRPARLTGGVRTGRRTHRLASRSLAGCRTYRLGLHYRHGTASLRVAVGRVAERRTVGF